MLVFSICQGARLSGENVVGQHVTKDMAMNRSKFTNNINNLTLTLDCSSLLREYTASFETNEGVGEQLQVIN